MNGIGKKTLAALLAVLAFFALLPSAAKAEASASFLRPLYVAAHGVTVQVQARVSAESESDWVLKTDSGTELGRVRAKETVVTFSVTVTRGMPYRNVLQLFCNDGSTALCETLLFCDRAQNPGVRQVATDAKRVAITFDAANAAANTLEILDLLDQYNAKATFFVIGKFAVINPDVCKEIVARGHELASHSYEHLEMIGATAEQAYTSIQKTDALLRTFNGDGRVLYRPPSGRSTFRDRTIARGLDSEVILWSIDSGDGFADTTENGVQSRVRNNLHNGGIVLMHVYGRYTRQALRVLLPYYAERGYAFVTVSDLLLDGETYIDAYGTQRALHHDETRTAQIAARLGNGG